MSDDEDSVLGEANAAVAESERLVEPEGLGPDARQSVQQAARGARAAANLALGVLQDADALRAAWDQQRFQNTAAERSGSDVSDSDDEQGNQVTRKPSGRGTPEIEQPQERDLDDAVAEEGAGVDPSQGGWTGFRTPERAPPIPSLAQELEVGLLNLDADPADATDARVQTLAELKINAVEDGVDIVPDERKIDAVEDGVDIVPNEVKVDVLQFLNAEAAEEPLDGHVIEVSAVPAVVLPEDVAVFVKGEADVQSFGTQAKATVMPYDRRVYDERADVALAGLPSVDLRDPKDYARFTGLGATPVTVLKESYRIPDLFVSETQDKVVQWAGGLEVVAARAGYFGGAKLASLPNRVALWHSNDQINDNLEPNPDRGIVSVWIASAPQASAQGATRTEHVFVQSYLGNRTRADLHTAADSAAMPSCATWVHQLDPVLARLRQVLNPTAEESVIVDLRFAVSRVPGPRPGASAPEPWWTDEQRRYPLVRKDADAETFVLKAEGTQPSPLLDIWVRVRVGSKLLLLDATGSPAVSVAPSAITEAYLDDEEKLKELGTKSLAEERVQLPDAVVAKDDGTVVVALASAFKGSLAASSTGRLAQAVRYALLRHEAKWVDTTDETGRRNAMRDLVRRTVKYTIGNGQNAPKDAEDTWMEGPTFVALLDKVYKAAKAVPKPQDAINKGRKIVQDYLAAKTRERSERRAALLTTGLWWLSLRKLYEPMAFNTAISAELAMDWLLRARCDLVDPARLPWLCAQTGKELASVLPNPPATPEEVKWGLDKPLDYDDADAWVDWRGWEGAVGAMVTQAIAQKRMTQTTAASVRWGMMQLWTFLSKFGLRVQQFPGGHLVPVWHWVLDAEQTKQLVARAVDMATSDGADYSTGTRSVTERTEPLPYATRAAGPGDASTDKESVWTSLCLDMARAVEWRFVYRNDDSSVDEVCTTVTEDGKRDTNCDLVLPGPPVFVGHARHFALVLSLDPARVDRVGVSVATGAGWTGVYQLPSGWPSWSAVQTHATLSPAPALNRPLAGHWCLRWGRTSMWCLRLANQLADLHPLAARDGDKLVQFLRWQTSGAKRPQERKEVAVHMQRKGLEVHITIHDTAAGLGAPPGLALALAAALVPLWRHSAPDGPFGDTAVRWRAELSNEAYLRLPWCMATDHPELVGQRKEGNIAPLFVHPFVAGGELGLGLALRPDLAYSSAGDVPNSSHLPWRMNARKAPRGSGKRGDLYAEGYMARIVMLAAYRALLRLPVAMLTDRIPVTETDSRTQLSSMDKTAEWSAGDLQREALGVAWWWLRRRTLIPGQDTHGRTLTAGATLGILTHAPGSTQRLPATARMPDSAPGSMLPSLVDDVAMNGLASLNSAQTEPVLSQIRPSDVTWAQELPLTLGEKSVRWAMTVASLLCTNYARVSEDVFVNYYDPNLMQPTKRWSTPFLSELQHATQAGGLLHLYAEPLSQQRWTRALNAVKLSEAQKKHLTTKQNRMLETMGTRVFQQGMDTGVPVVCNTYEDLRDLHVVQCLVLNVLHGTDNSSHARNSRSSKRKPERNPRAGVGDSELQGLIGAVGDLHDASDADDDADNQGEDMKTRASARGAGGEAVAAFNAVAQDFGNASDTESAAGTRPRRRRNRVLASPRAEDAAPAGAVAAATVPAAVAQNLVAVNEDDEDNVAGDETVVAGITADAAPVDAKADATAPVDAKADDDAGDAAVEEEDAKADDAAEEEDAGDAAAGDGDAAEEEDVEDAAAEEGDAGDAAPMDEEAGDEEKGDPPAPAAQPAAVAAVPPPVVVPQQDVPQPVVVPPPAAAVQAETTAVELDLKEALRNATLILGTLGSNTEAMMLSLYHEDGDVPAEAENGTGLYPASVGFAPMSLAASPPGHTDVIPGSFALGTVHGGRMPVSEDADWIAFLPISVCPPPLEQAGTRKAFPEAVYERDYARLVSISDTRETWRTAKYLLPPDGHTLDGTELNSETPSIRQDLENSMRSLFATLAFLEVLFVQPSNPLRLFHIVAHLRLAMPFLSGMSRRPLGIVGHDIDSWTSAKQNNKPNGSSPLFLLQHEYFNGQQSASDQPNALVNLMLNALARRRWPMLVAHGDTLELHFPSGLVLQRRSFEKEPLLKVDMAKLVAIEGKALSINAVTSNFKILRPSGAAFVDLKLDAGLVYELASAPADGTVVPTAPYRCDVGRKGFWTGGRPVRIPNRAHDNFIHMAALLRDARSAIARDAYGLDHDAVPAWMPWPSDAQALLHAVMPVLRNVPDPTDILVYYWDIMLRCFSNDPSQQSEEEKMQRMDYRFVELGPSRVDISLDGRIRAVDAAFGTAPLNMLQSSTSTVDKWLVAWDGLLRTRVSNKAVYHWNSFPLAVAKSIILDDVRNPVLKRAAAGAALLAICNSAWMETLRWPVNALAVALRGKWARRFQIDAEAMRQFFYLQALATEPTLAKVWKLILSTEYTDGEGRTFAPGTWQVNPVVGSYVQMVVNSVAGNRPLREYALSIPRVGQLRDGIMAVAMRLWSSIPQYTTSQDEGDELWFFRNRLLKQRVAILRDGVDVPTHTAGPFHLRNWTVDQNLGHLDVAMGDLENDTRFVELVEQISNSIRSDANALDEAVAGRIRALAAGPDEYLKNEKPARRKQLDAIIAGSAWGLSSHAERGARGLFMLAESMRPSQETRVDVKSVNPTFGDFWTGFTEGDCVPMRLLQRQSMWLRVRNGSVKSGDGFIVSFPDAACPAFVVQACDAESYGDDFNPSALAAVLVAALELDLKVLEFAPSVDAAFLSVGDTERDELRSGMQAWLSSVLMQRITAIPHYQPKLLSDVMRAVVAPPPGSLKLRRIRVHPGGIAIESTIVPTPRCAGGCALIIDSRSGSLEALCDVVYTIRACSPKETLALFALNLPPQRTGCASLCYHPACAPALQLARRGRDDELTRKDGFGDLVQKYVMGAAPDGMSSKVFATKKATKVAATKPTNNTASKPAPAKKVAETPAKKVVAATPAKDVPAQVPSGKQPSAAGKKSTKEKKPKKEETATPAVVQEAAAKKKKKKKKKEETEAKASEETESDDNAPARPDAAESKKRTAPRKLPDFGANPAPKGYISTADIYSNYYNYTTAGGKKSNRATAFATYAKNHQAEWEKDSEVRKHIDPARLGVPFLTEDQHIDMLAHFAALEDARVHKKKKDQTSDEPEV